LIVTNDIEAVQNKQRDQVSHVARLILVSVNENDSCPLRRISVVKGDSKPAFRRLHRHALFIHFFLQMQFGGRSNGPKALRLWIEIVYGQLIVFNIYRCVNRMTIPIAIKSRDKVFAGGCR
jgi:hypothetical protein